MVSQSLSIIFILFFFEGHFVLETETGCNFQIRPFLSLNLFGQTFMTTTWKKVVASLWQLAKCKTDITGLQKIVSTRYCILSFYFNWWDSFSMLPDGVDARRQCSEATLWRADHQLGGSAISCDWTGNISIHPFMYWHIHQWHASAVKWEGGGC